MYWVGIREYTVDETSNLHALMYYYAFSCIKHTYYYMYLSRSPAFGNRQTAYFGIPVRAGRSPVANGNFSTQKKGLSSMHPWYVRNSLILLDSSPPRKPALWASTLQPLRFFLLFSWTRFVPTTTFWRHSDKGSRSGPRCHQSDITNTSQVVALI